MKFRRLSLGFSIFLMAAAAQANPVSINFIQSGNASNSAISIGQSKSAITAEGLLAIPRSIPEPAILALFGSGLIAIASTIRRSVRRDNETTDKK